MLVRGRVLSDGWVLEPRPNQDLDAAACAAHKRAMAVRGGYYFSDAGKERILTEVSQ